MRGSVVRSILRNKKGQVISVIIPTLNEALNIPHVLKDIPAEMELIIVDGHSIDGTPDLARKIRPNAKIVFQKGKGKGNAIKCGLKYATGKCIVFMDGDYSHNPREIPTLIAKLKQGYDIVQGSRFMSGGGSEDLTPLRRFGARLITYFINLLFGTKYTDVCYGFIAIKRNVLDKIDYSSLSDDIIMEAQLLCRAAKSGLRVAQVPSFERKRLHGNSSFNTLRIGLLNFAIIIKEWLDGLKKRIRAK